MKPTQKFSVGSYLERFTTAELLLFALVVVMISTKFRASYSSPMRGGHDKLELREEWNRR